MAGLFRKPEAWTGGSVDLLLWFDGSTSVSALDVLSSIWTWPSLDGPVLNSLEEFSVQARVNVRDLEADGIPSLYGVALLPNKTSTVCACHLLTEERGFFVTFGLPLGSLGGCYPVGAYPFEGSPSDAWAKEIHAWLAELARHVHVECPSAGGIIGWLTTMEFDEVKSGDVPDIRYHGYLTVSKGELNYLEPNTTAPLMTLGSA